jgi:hypothetical protein
VRKAHGEVKDVKGKVLIKAHSPPDEGYQGTKSKDSLLVKSNVVENCLDPVWFEVEVELSRCEQILLMRLLNDDVL